MDRIHRIKKLLDRIAYISLFFDVAIAMITLLSIRIFIYEPATLLAYVNYGLTVVVLIGAFLFLLITVLSYYDKIYDAISMRMFRKRH